MKVALGWVALILTVAGYGPYIVGIVRGKLKLHKYTWGIWTILTAIAAFNQVENHGGYSSLFVAGTAVLATVTFLLSLKYGVGGAGLLDKICLVLAVGLFVYWLVVHDTRFSTVLLVNIDLLGAIPTVAKTYRRPQTENYSQWVLSTMAAGLTLLTVPRLDWALLLYPAYVMIADGSIVAIKALRQAA